MGWEELALQWSRDHCDLNVHYVFGVIPTINFNFRDPSIMLSNGDSVRMLLSD